MARSTAQNLDFTDIYMNQEKIMEVFNRQEKRKTRFDKQLVQHHKAYGNKIYKKRQDEYFEGVKADQYKTPFLRLRDQHRCYSSKLTKAQKVEQIQNLQNRRKKKEKVEDNYIKAYQNDMMPVTADQVISTLNQMQGESEILFNANQKTENTITKTLIEALAEEKLNKMSSNQLVNALEEYNKSQTLISETNKQIQADDERQRAQYKLANQDVEQSSSITSSASENEDIMDKEKKEKQQKERTSVLHDTAPYSNLVRQSTNHFSFEERFKAFIGLKVSDNMQILQEKRRQEYNVKVNQMLEGDIDKLFTNAEFRKFIDPLQQECMLIDLTHQFINRAVVKGSKNHQDKENKVNNIPSAATSDHEENNNRKSSQRSLEKASSIGSIEGKKRKGSKKHRHSETKQDEVIHFCPNLGLDFSKIKSLYDIRDKEHLFHRVQYVLERMDKERYKAFRSGRLSLAQCVSRVEAETKNGLKYTVLDDLRHEFDEEALRKPTQATKMAYNEQVIEDRLLRNAKKRGIDPVLLKKTARNLNVQARCAKSMYARPMKKNVNFDTQQAFKLEENKRQLTKERKQMLDTQKREDKIKAIEKKDKDTIRKLHALSLKDPRAEYRESCESKTINNRLYGQKYYFIPERYREALLEEFHKTYNEEQQKNESHANQSTQNQRNASDNKKARPVGKKETRSKFQMSKSQEIEWFKKMGYDVPLDDETRHYLKRMKKDNPQARIQLPEGFYDSDEDEENRKREQLTRRLTGGVMTVFEVGLDGNLEATSPQLPKRSATIQTQNTKSGQNNINSNNNDQVKTPGQDRQVLGALSVTQEQNISSSNASQVGDAKQQHQEQQNKKLTIYHQGQTMSEGIPDKANNKKNGLGVALIISHNGKEIKGFQQQQPILSPNKNDPMNNTQELGDNHGRLLNISNQPSSNGGIIEDPKQRKRTASAIDKYRQGSALDGMDHNASLQDNYGCKDQQQKIKSPGEGRNTQMQLHGVFDKNSNFPLSSFQTGNNSTISKNFVEVALENNDKIEPEFKMTSPQVSSKLAKRTSQALIGNKQRSLLNNSSISSYQQRTNQRKEKKLSQETLVIGGLVKNKSTAQVRNKSALSKEYHSRHTRHIRGQSALSRHTTENKLWQNRTSIQSTKFTQQTLSQKESVFGGAFAEPQNKVPDSVVEWYNEMIGPVFMTQKFKDHEASVMDYENQSPYNMQQQLAATASLKIGRHRNRGAAKAQKQSAKISTVEQQQAPYMTLNQDISEGDEIDFAFAVQNGRSIKDGNASTKNDSISQRYTFDENKTFRGGIYNTQGSIPSTSHVSQVSPFNNNRPKHQNHNRVRGMISDNQKNAAIKSQPVEMVNQMAGMSQTSQINSFDWTNIQTSSLDTQQQQRKGYNWLTGANMTENNLENLEQVKQHIIVSNKGGTNLFLHERAPRQLLVNESVLRRNKIYRQQGTQIQPGSPAIGLMVTPGGAEISQNASEPEIRYPATQLINQAEADESSLPDQDSDCSRNVYMIDATGLHQQNFSSDYNQQVAKGESGNVPLVAVTTSKTMFDVIRSQQLEHQLVDLDINNSTMGETQIIQPIQQNRVLTGVGSTERRGLDSSSTNRQRQNQNQGVIKSNQQPSNQVSKFANLLQENQDMTTVMGVRAKSTGVYRSRPATSVARPQENNNTNKSLLKIHRMDQPKDAEKTRLRETMGKGDIKNRQPASTVNRNQIKLVQNPNTMNQSLTDSVVQEAAAAPQNSNDQSGINVIMKGRTIQKQANKH